MKAFQIIKTIQEESAKTIYNNAKFYAYNKFLSHPLFEKLLSVGYINDSTYVIFGKLKPSINIDSLAFNESVEYECDLTKTNEFILVFYNIEKTSSISYSLYNSNNKIRLYNCIFNFNYLKGLTNKLKQTLIHRLTIEKWKTNISENSLKNFYVISYKKLNTTTKNECLQKNIEYIENIEALSEENFYKQIESIKKDKYLILLYHDELINYETLNCIQFILETEKSKHLIIGNFKTAADDKYVIPRFHSHSSHCNNLISENSFVINQDILDQVFSTNYQELIYNLQVYAQDDYNHTCFCPAIFTTTNTPKPKIENFVNPKSKKSDISQKVSIIIPFKDKIDLLAKCLSTIKENTSYSNYEIVLVNNNSRQNKTYEFLTTLNDSLITVLDYNDEFNYSQINNFAVTKTTGSYLIFLNNDTEIITTNWITKMMEYVTLDEVGAVGPLLLFEDQSIQQQGVYLSYRDLNSEYPIIDHISQNLSATESITYDIIEPKAITGACLLTSKSHFNKYGPFDATNLPINFSDIDYCLKLIQDNKKILVLNDIKVIHKESATRDLTVSAHKEFKYFHSKWKQEFDDLEIKYI